MATRIQIQGYVDMDIWVGTCEYGYMDVDIWIWIYDYGYMNTVIWIWMLGHGHINTVIWTWIYGNAYMDMHYVGERRVPQGLWEHCWGRSEGSWEALGPSCGLLGGSWEPLGAILRLLREVLVSPSLFHRPWTILPGECSKPPFPPLIALQLHST